MTCQQCGKDKAYKDGLCIGCYSIRTIQQVVVEPEHVRIEPPKPIRVEPLRPPKRSKPCSNCGGIPVSGKGRCNKCYKYFVRHGAERPEQLSLKAPKPLRPPRVPNESCLNCGKATRVGRRLCEGCHSYQRKYGSPRPPELYARQRNKDRVCENCRLKPVMSMGRCQSCYNYKYIHGSERPSAPWIKKKNNQLDHYYIAGAMITTAILLIAALVYANKER